MLKKIIDWRSILTVVSEKTKRTKTDICREMGIDGAARTKLTGATPFVDLRHSEGEFLLGLYGGCTDAEIPRLTRSPNGLCPCCSRTTLRANLMRMDSGKFRCLTCIANLKKPTK